jgi:hypothetical protein
MFTAPGRKVGSPVLSADQNVMPVIAGLGWHSSTRELDGETDESPAEYVRLKGEYLLLIEWIGMLEAENTDLRLTIQFYRDLCLDDDCT